MPFNGWYMDTEIMRDFLDEYRYNKMEEIAQVLKLDTLSFFNLVLRRGRHIRLARTHLQHLMTATVINFSESTPGNLACHGRQLVCLSLQNSWLTQ
jgi:hypothetical protein